MFGSVRLNILPFLLAMAVIVPVNADRFSELESLRMRIKDVESSIQDAKNETEKLTGELRENELISAETATRLDAIAATISEKNSELKALNAKRIEHENLLKQEKQKLVNQIRSAYRAGRNDYIKLLLNQEDPALVGRTLAYYDYHNRVRAARINHVQQTLADLNAIQMAIESETRQLTSLKTEQESKLNDFREYRTSRYTIVVRLQKFIETQGVELLTLQENERELGKLLTGLRSEAAVTTRIAAGLPPFNSLRGKLDWPVPGKLLQHFGSKKNVGDLKWQGVLIDAETGTGVKAVGAGKVVFADWFKNLGLLMIIDHGDGYMSLYGHNQNLLKNTGDRVLAGETIATVGDSGGRRDTALYFEIRNGAKPLNPALWVKR